jgi:hypothetical protein
MLPVRILIIYAGLPLTTIIRYRLLRSLFVQTTHWCDHDPFLTQKVKTFQQSGTSILRMSNYPHQVKASLVIIVFSEIATIMHELENEKNTLGTDNIGVLFNEMIQMCLWLLSFHSLFTSFAQCAITQGKCDCEFYLLTGTTHEFIIHRICLY